MPDLKLHSGSARTSHNGKVLRNAGKGTAAGRVLREDTITAPQEKDSNTKEPSKKQQQEATRARRRQHEDAASRRREAAGDAKQ
jgi:hypothetical protein